MVQQLGGPTAALEAVKPQLNSALSVVGLSGSLGVGVTNAADVLGKKAKRSKPRTKPPAPAKPPASPPPPPKKALPGTPPAQPKRAPPQSSEMALTQVKKRSKRGLPSFIGAHAKEWLANVKNVIVKRK